MKMEVIAMNLDSWKSYNDLYLLCKKQKANNKKIKKIIKEIKKILER
jgi:hypothetical protein